MGNNQANKTPRRRQILESLARELEGNPGSRITTAGLARAVGISEAALYRHFPSKAKMFEGLIQFSEDTVFELINRIQIEQARAEDRCQALLQVLLGFADRNPGITRILLGDALVGEHERLRIRVSQFYERVELQIKQFIREGVMRGELAGDTDAAMLANLLMAAVEGKMSQFVRSGFSRRPLEHWERQWPLLRHSVFADSTA